MFGIGPMEFLVIAVVAVVFVGPDKLPDLIKKFGRFYVQAKRHANEVKSGFDEAIHQAERELELERIRELQKKLSLASVTETIDAVVTESTSTPQPDPGHTPDGRLIEPTSTTPSQTTTPASTSALPPGELQDQSSHVYHEGHLPPRNHPEGDHDPFAELALKNHDLGASTEAKPEDKDKKPT